MVEGVGVAVTDTLAVLTDVLAAVVGVVALVLDFGPGPLGTEAEGPELPPAGVLGPGTTTDEPVTDPPPETETGVAGPTGAVGAEETPTAVPGVEATAVDSPIMVGVGADTAEAGVPADGNKGEVVAPAMHSAGVTVT